MLDTFEILTTTGIVLWSKSYANIGANVINSFISDVFIEERGLSAAGLANGPTSDKPAYQKDKYTLKWTTAKDLGLIFVVCAHVLLLLLRDHILTFSAMNNRPSTSLSYISPGSIRFWKTSKLSL